MNSSYYSSYITSEDLSVEVNSDDYSFIPNQYDPIGDLDLSSLFDIDLFRSDVNVASAGESADFVGGINDPSESDELDKYFGPKHSSNSTLDIDRNLLVPNNLPGYNVEQSRKRKLSKTPILLSQSVGVGPSQRPYKPSHQIKIVNELEKTYRPRYKSDYFTQSGKTRKPRYVCDRLGNHYITLQVPLGIRGQIRVDWLTIPNENNRRFFMPYQFQVVNDSTDIPDCNPIMLNIDPDELSSTMRLYLVLIKTKQDALKSLQPLKPFYPMHEVLGMIDKCTPEKTAILTPKQLIQKHQLGKSQLAFTLCVQSADGQSYIPEWNTTVYSTVLEEESNESVTRKIVACPHCSTSIAINDDGTAIEEIAANKRQSLQMKDRRIKKQKNLSCITYRIE